MGHRFLSHAPSSLSSLPGLFLKQEYPPFVPCTAAPWSGCNETQYGQWRTWGSQFLAHLNASVGGALPPQKAAAGALRMGTAAHGGFLHSCPTHGTCISGRCTSVNLASTGATAYGTLLEWWGNTGSRPVWAIDDAWPAHSLWPAIKPPNKMCPPP
jgi:hypothetical protein